ncbi:uncharacterized protein LOC116188410 isoform X2 [Punica granatum]|uniref:Uncharacterized protein LOC116188410 isoform X2 n=1 Tax=Punica granatum TaxID=22663 RepID=A0A6P8BTT5_PUNGR|nr:uncharacterized protein LOC116188410 isoform X2 [Punica granatum]
MDFHGMKRKQLQSLCKKHGIPANLKNSEMADRLSSIFKEIEKPEGGERSSLSDVQEIARETDSKDMPQRAKKVRFSPEDETFIFISSDVESTVVKKRSGRRKYGKKLNQSALVPESSKETEDSVGNTRVQAARTRRTRAGRAAGVNRDATEIIDLPDDATAVGESSSGREPTGRQQRRGGRAMVEKNMEVGLEKNSRKRYLEKDEGCNGNDNGTKRLTRQSKPSVVKSKLESTGRATRSRAWSLEKAPAMEGGNEDVRVQAESETGHVLQLGERPGGLARKTRNSIALYKDLDTVLVSDAVTCRKSLPLSISRKREDAPVAAALIGEKVNGLAVEKNVKERLKNSVTEEGSSENTLGCNPVSREVLPRRSRRQSVMSRLLINGEFSVEKIAYSLKQHDPVAKESTRANPNEPSGKAHMRGSKRNSPKVSSLVPRKKILRATTKKQKRVSRMESVEEVAEPESESTVAPIEHMNLDVKLNVPETELGEEVTDVTQACQIEASAIKEVSFMDVSAQKAEEERVASESDKSLVTEHVESKTACGENNEDEELLMDNSEDYSNEVGSLRKCNLAKVSDAVCYKPASHMNSWRELSSATFGSERGLGTEPFIVEQEICEDTIEVDDHLVTGSSNHVRGNGQNFQSQELVLAEQKDELRENKSSGRNSEEVIKPTEDRGYLDCNKAEESSISELEDINSGLPPAVPESAKESKVTIYRSMSCSSMLGAKMHIEEFECASLETELPQEIPCGAKIDLNNAVEVMNAGDELPNVQASVAAEEPVDKGGEYEVIEENGEKAPVENSREPEDRRMVRSPHENVENITDSVLSKQYEVGTEKQMKASKVVFSAEVTPKSEFPVAFKEPLTLDLELNIPEVANYESGPEIEPLEVTDSIQGNGSHTEAGAEKELHPACLKARSSAEEECDALQSNQPLVTEPMDSKTIIREENGSEEMLQDFREDNLNEIHSLHVDELVELQAVVHVDKLGIASYPMAAPVDSPGGLSDTEQLVVEQETYARNIKLNGHLTVGSFDSIQGSPGTSPSLQSMQDLVEEFTKKRSSGESSGDMIEKAEKRDGDRNSSEKTNLADKEVSGFARVKETTDESSPWSFGSSGEGNLLEDECDSHENALLPEIPCAREINTNGAVEAKSAQNEMQNVRRTLVVAELHACEIADENGQTAEDKKHEALEGNVDNSPKEIIWKPVTGCSENNDAVMIVTPTKNRTAPEKSSISDAVVSMQGKCDHKDDISISKTAEEKGSQEKNKEEIAKEENENDKAPNFAREFFGSVEKWPIKNWQTDGTPISCSRKSGLAFQIEEDEKVNNLMAAEDNQVDVHASSAAAFQYEVSVSGDEDENVSQGQNKEEIKTEDGNQKGFHLRREPVNIEEVCLNEDPSAGGMSLSCLGKSGSGFKIEKAEEYDYSETRKASSCKIPSAEERRVDEDENTSADLSLQAPSDFGDMLLSSYELTVSPNKDVHEDERDEGDKQHSPDSDEANNIGQQLELNAERTSNLITVDTDSSIFPPEEPNKLYSPELLRNTHSCDETSNELHSAETVEKASFSKNFSAGDNVTDSEFFDELYSETNAAQFNNSMDMSSSKKCLEVGLNMEKQTVRLAENNKMDQEKEAETGEMALAVYPEKNAVTASVGLESSDNKIANAGDNYEAVGVDAFLANLTGISNISDEKDGMMECYSEMNISSIGTGEEEDARVEQKSTMSLDELAVRETSDKHELPLNGLNSYTQRDKINISAEYSSFTYETLNKDTDTIPNIEENEEMQNPAIEGGGDLESSLPPCEEVAALEQFIGFETASQEQSVGDETAPNGQFMGNESTAKEQISVLTKSYIGLRTLTITKETSDETSTFNAGSSSKRGRETDFTAISRVRTSTECENKTSDSDSQLFTSKEIGLFLGGKTDGPEGLVSKAIEADFVKEDIVDIKDKSQDADMAVIIPKYSDHDSSEDEQVEAEDIFEHKTEEILEARSNDSVAAAEELHIEATGGTSNEQEDDDNDASAMIQEYIDREKERGASIETVNPSPSANKESSQECEWSTSTTISIVESAEVLVSRDETKHQEVAWQDEAFKSKDTALSESSLKKTNFSKTLRKLPSTFDKMKENIYGNTKREQLGGSITAGKTSTKGRRALEELHRNQSQPLQGNDY